MASREERMQQRLRGAQRRQIQDVDFGLLFPATFDPGIPVQPQPSSLPKQIPVQSALDASAQETPKNLHLLSASGSDASNPAKVLSPPVWTPNANTSRKRRKLIKGKTPSTSSQTPRPSLRESISSLSPIPQDKVLPDVIFDDFATGSTRQAYYGGKSPIAGLQSVNPSKTGKTPINSLTVEEVTESPPNAPGSGKRVSLDTSFLASSRSLRMLKDGRQPPVITPPLPPEKIRGIIYPAGLGSPDLSYNTSIRVRPAQANDVELDELSPERHDLQSPLLKISTTEIDPPSANSDELESAVRMDDDQMMSLSKKHHEQRNRNIGGKSADLESPKNNFPLKKEQKTQFDHLPFQLKKPSSRVRRQSSTKAGRNKIRHGSPIPITVHRLTTPRIYDDDCIDAQILNMKMPHVRRDDVNVIDVLSQICQEIAESELSTLKEQAESCKDAAPRREFRAQWQALGKFENELQTRLLEYALDLDNTYSLERRLRDEQKQKICLREEILRARAEREQVAVQMDEIRAQHEKVRHQGMAQDNLNNALHELELVIDLGREKFPHAPNDVTDLSGSDVLLKKVAQDISIKSTTRGLMTQVKDFNEFLERAAFALENRMGRT